MILSVSAVSAEALSDVNSLNLVDNSGISNFNGNMDDLYEYLTMLNDPDELFYLLLEKFFKSESKEERE